MLDEQRLYHDTGTKCRGESRQTSSFISKVAYQRLEASHRYGMQGTGQGFRDIVAYGKGELCLTRRARWKAEAERVVGVLPYAIVEDTETHDSPRVRKRHALLVQRPTAYISRRTDRRLKPVH